MSSITERALLSLASGIQIDRMTEHDLLEVVEIEEQSGLSRWGWSAYYLELQSRHSFMYVARLVNPLERDDGATLAGYIVARISGNELHINNVAVYEEYRRSGLGTGLLRRVVKDGAEAGAELAFLEVRSANSAAKRLYERCGFTAVGVRKNYYSGPLDDAVIMRVKLKDDP
ncbi:MAG TPA: ribosomal protein S18-alanine N-acetyltransferase [Pyrinomonadaceae bacterium]|nr:ribosomal protein S18-alanine N-acetyltransferase [Pyrinomonadaceae bacterium]